MSRVLNFSAGPSMLPEAVLNRAKDECLNWQNSGQSVMEMSHRSKTFLSIAQKLESSLRSVMSIPDNYKVLFLQGGASAQFAMIPMNLLQGKQTACYINSGAWSKKAIAEAKKYCTVKVSASGEDGGFCTVPNIEQWQIDHEAAYLHYTSNETINGVEFPFVPEVGLPLVADMSSNILSRTVDVNKFGLIYAGSQKNMGPAGVTVVIVRDDLLDAQNEAIPSVFSYAQQAANDSMLNTPATYNWYLLGLMLDWLEDLGGVSAIEKINITKADKLYQAIDGSTLFQNNIDVTYRSRMNVPFVLSDPDLLPEFLLKASDQGMVELKGHRSVGGVRASIYNAMPEKGVDKLIQFMKEFERTH